jgi:hypothetical protein
MLLSTLIDPATPVLMFDTRIINVGESTAVRKPRQFRFWQIGRSLKVVEGE